MRAKEFTQVANVSEAGTGLMFKGYPCTKDCSGHEAGYAWAKYWGITDSDNCPIGNSNSFREGCLARCAGKSK